MDSDTGVGAERSQSRPRFQNKSQRKRLLERTIELRHQRQEELLPSIAAAVVEGVVQRCVDPEAALAYQSRLYVRGNIAAERRALRELGIVPVRHESSGLRRNRKEKEERKRVQARKLLRRIYAHCIDEVERERFCSDVDEWVAARSSRRSRG